MFGFSSGKSNKAKVIPTDDYKKSSKNRGSIHQYSSFGRENIDDLIGEIDEVEASPKVTVPSHPLRRESLEDIDEILHELDDVQQTSSITPVKPEEKLLHIPSMEGSNDFSEGSSLSRFARRAVSLNSSDRKMSIVLDDSGAVLSLTKQLKQDSVTKFKSSDSLQHEDIQVAEESKETTHLSSSSLKEDKHESAISLIDRDIINMKEAHLKGQVEERFKVLMSQIIEFQVRLRRFAGKLSDQEVLQAELEENIEELEKDNIMLKKKLTNREANMAQGGISANVSEKLFGRHDVHRDELLFEESPGAFAFKIDSSSAQRRAAGLSSPQTFEIIINTFIPFSNDVRKIQSRFGSAVASYFEFYRFMFLQFSLVAAISLVLCVFHLALNTPKKGARVVSSRGVAPWLMKFSSFAPSENLSYSSIVVCGSIIFALSLFYHVVSKDKVEYFPSIELYI
jgi:hypothetical protein